MSQVLDRINSRFVDRDSNTEPNDMELARPGASMHGTVAEVLRSLAGRGIQ